MPNNATIICFFMNVIFSLTSWTAAGQALPNKQNDFRHFTFENGLSSNQTLCVHQDAKGFLWIGTTEGLNRFDGKNVIQFFYDPHDKEHSLSGNTVTHISSHGNLLIISTNHGISIYDISQNKFVNNIIQNDRFNFRSNELINYVVKHNNSWYVGGEKILILLNEDFSINRDLIAELNEHKKETYRDFLPPTVDENNNLYFGCCGGLFHYECATNKFTFESNIAEKIQLGILHTCHTTSPMLFKDKMVQFGWANNPKIFSRTDNKEDAETLQLIGPDPRYNGTTVFCEMINPNEYWIGTEEGLFVWNASSSTIQSIALNGTSPNCRYVFKDQQQNIWIATDHGLFELLNSQNHFEIIPIPQTTFEPIKLSVQSFTKWQNDIWMITNDGVSNAIGHLQNGKWNVLEIPCITKGTRSLGLLSNEELVIGAWSGGAVLNSKTNACNALDFIPKDLREKPIIFILKDSHQNLWLSLGQSNGLLRKNLKTGEMTHYVNNERLASNQKYIPIASAVDMIEDHNGNIWMVRSKLDGKLICWNASNDTFEEITPTNHDAKDMHYNGESYCVSADENAIWFGVVREGLFRYDIAKNKLEQFTRKDGLPSNDVMAIEVDQHGIIWIATMQGLAAFHYQEKTFDQFTSSSGLREMEFASSSCYDEQNDRMYFSTIGSVISFHPNELLEPIPFPNVYLTAVHIDGLDYGISARQFDADETHIEFDFSAPNMIFANEFEFRYRLDGLETNWNYAGNNNSAAYANIPSGNYALVVSVKTRGVWSDGSKIYSFHLPQHFYKSIFFYLFLATLFCLGMYLLYIMRIRRLKRIESLRTQISRDLHDDIGSALSSIRIMSGSSNNVQNKSSEILTKIHQSSQRVLDNMDDIIWTIHPDNDLGEQLLVRMREFASEVLEASNIECHFHFDENIEQKQFDLQLKRNVYLIFKEAVNNAAKYSQAKNVMMTFQLLNHRSALLEVKDDGVGFVISEVNTGHGLTNLQKRSAEMGGSISIHSSPNEGTFIRLNFQLH